MLKDDLVDAISRNESHGVFFYLSLNPRMRKIILRKRDISYSSSHVGRYLPFVAELEIRELDFVCTVGVMLVPRLRTDRP